MDLRFWIESTLRSYSLIFFSRKLGLGLVILLATMITPSHGIFGLGGALFANLIAFFMGFNRQEIQQGYWGFNGVLISLGLSLYYEYSAQLILLTLISVFFMTLFTMGIKNFLAVYGLPYMSIPFNLIIYASILASFATGYLEPSVEKWQLFDVTLSSIPVSLNLFFKNLGAIFFNINPISGIIIATGLLLFSRISLLLIIVGWVVGYHIHSFLGINPYIIEHQYLGFNYMLTALALGGVFFIPNLSTLLLAVLGVFIATLNLTALEIALPYYLSSLALSFNLSVLIVVYALKMRYYPSLGINLAAEVVSPEENLRRARENLKVWRRYGVQLALPFYGEWVVTQAFNGEHTHKDEWAYAYDFMIKDEAGKLYSGDGSKLSDYYCYEAPVLAPAKGKVVLIKNDTPDNLPGQTNPMDNWGNCIIIEHAPHYFTCLAHLKRGSFTVQEGEEVEKGQKIGLCGNSGRSPYPHIHMQLQAFTYVGAPSLYFEYSNVVIKGDAFDKLLPRGMLSKEDRVSNIDYDENFTKYFPYEVDKEWHFSFANGHPSTKEIWEVKIDFHNNPYLEDNHGSKLYFEFSDGVLTVKKYEGKRNTGLYFLAQTLVDAAFPATAVQMRWDTETALEYMLPPFVLQFLDFFSILGIRLLLRIENSLEKNQSDTVFLKQELSVYLNFLRWRYLVKKFDQPRQMLFKKGEGISFIKDGNSELLLKEIKIND